MSGARVERANGVRTEVIAVIPARGGSKGIPGKNLRQVGGIPLVARAVKAALRAEPVRRVIVSTDDEAIGKVALEAGGEVIWRPAELSGDQAASELALLHVLEHLEAAEGYRPDILLFVQCTSPFIAPEDLEGVARLVGEEGYDSAFTGWRTHGFLWRRTTEGTMEGVNHDKTARPMRQSRPPEYLETGAAYAMRVEGFLRARHRFFGRTGVYEVPRVRALEIDEPEDLRMAEALAPLADGGLAECWLPRRTRAVIFDFDGVLTDNRVLVMEDGREGVLCSRADGMGIELLRRAGIECLILSKERNGVVAARARKLGIDCVQGVDDKLPAMRGWLEKKGIALADCVYVGNDVNDIECLKAAGCGVCVADAYPEAIRAAKVVLRSSGGEGAARELCERILEAMAHD